MRDYPALHLDTNKSKKTVRLLLFYISQSRIYSVCRNHSDILSSFMTYDQVCNKSNRVGATSVAGTAYPPGTPGITSGFQWNSCCFIFTVQCCGDNCLSFCSFPLLSTLLQFTASDYPFGIFKHFTIDKGNSITDKTLIVQISNDSYTNKSAKYMDNKARHKK